MASNLTLGTYAERPGKIPFALPVQAVTSTFGILAKKGAGKSNAAVVMAEEMFAATVPFVVVDPKGDWWGMRSNQDGTGPGLPLVVFGGRHADIPLEPTGGALIADLILARGLSCILDVSQFSKADIRRFLHAFGDRLYRQAEDLPMHVFMEEAHEYLPQVVRGPDAELVEVWQRIVKQGRFKGLGCTLVSQRSAALNKDVLTQVDSLIVLRTTSPQDRAAVNAWIDVHDASREVIRELPSLADGEAWVWAPALDDEQLTKIQFRRRATFDSGATPQVGAKARTAPATLADVDLDELRVQMADTIERAKADDPKELRRRIARLEDDLRRVAAARDEAVARADQAERHVQTVIVPDYAWFPLDQWREMTGRIDAQAALAADIQAIIARALANTSSTTVTMTDPGLYDLRQANSDRPLADGKEIVGPPIGDISWGDEQNVRAAPVVVRSRPAHLRAVEGDASDPTLGKAERSILAVLAQFPNGRTARQIAMLTGYSSKGGGYRNALSSLRSRRFITRSDPITVTESGLAALGNDYDPLPTGSALLDHWLEHPTLGLAERKILLAIPIDGSRDLAAIAEATGYSPSGGGFRNALSRLRTLELIERGNPIRLHPDFAEAIR